MDEAWIINMQDMLNERCEVKEMATPAKGVFEKMTKIISIATSQGVNSEISTGVRCLRFNACGKLSCFAERWDDLQLVLTEDKSVFVDTNILVYCNNKDSSFCKPAREKLDEFITKGNILFISEQVLREYLVIMTRPGILEKPISPELAVDDIKRMQEQFNVLFPDDKTLDILSDLIVRQNFP
ncbi:MAG: hypothetical protein DRH12_14895 [Deltaproteobacteria bacterium]|nr:MAG: hypothetical protein DRH12_14895 [Deltaproteobacteria bacterium]